MPELPEVQSVVDSLAPRVTGARVLRAMLFRQDIASTGRFTRPRPGTAPASPTPDLATLLAGRTVTSISRRAKRIVFSLDDGATFFVHLGMTGALTLAAPDSPLPKHTHLVLTLSPAASQLPTSNSQLLLFSDPRRFGKLVYLPPDSPDHDDDVGPEPLTLPPARLHRLLLATKRPLKSALLDQRLIAGLGNIYVDEALHAARLHPLRPSCSTSADEALALSRAIKRILRRAIKAKGSTLRDYRDADGVAGSFQNSHRVYGREGKPCRTCRSPITRLVLGGRSTHVCTTCQPQRPATG